MTFHSARVLAAVAMLLAAGPASAASLERAQEAQARGDLRAAQIELRNAVRSNPNDAALRAALATASLDVGDGDTAVKEARAALDRGFDPVAGTTLLLRGYLIQGRTRELLKDFPVPTDPARAAVGARIAAARALAQLSLDDRDGAKASVAEALQMGPNAAEPHLAASIIDEAAGDRAAAEAAVDRALQIEPTNADAVIRKANLLLARGAAADVVSVLGPLVKRAPGNVLARLVRAEAYLKLGNDAEARREDDAALRTMPNNAAAVYLRGVLLTRAKDWRGADEVFQQLGSTLGKFPEGYLLAALVKRTIGQTVQAEDLVQRYIARQPADPRGVKLLATIELEQGKKDVAVQTLSRLVANGGADAEALEMLSRLQAAAGKQRAAAETLEKAAALLPNNAEILARLAAARFAAGDTEGASHAAQASLRLAPDQQQPQARVMLAFVALAHGDLAAAEAEVGKLPPTARDTEAVGVLEGIIQIGRLNLPAARQTLEDVLRKHPESTSAQLNLVRVLLADNAFDDAVRVLGEVVQRDPTNAAALTQLSSLARSGGPGAHPARTALKTAQAGAPAEQGLALAYANVLLASGEAAHAAAVLESVPLKEGGNDVALSLARSQTYAALNRWDDAETEARRALAEQPKNAAARRQVVALLVRAGAAPAAEILLREGLQLQPANAVLQQTLLGVVQQARGLDAALTVANELAHQQTAQPESRLLPGNLLLFADRPADAARAFAAAYNEAPSVQLALREAAAWRAARQPADATAALNNWLQRDPENPDALEVLAQIDIEAGRFADAERRLEVVVAHAPTNVVALNNLAWLLGEHDDAADGVRALSLAQRAYFLVPSVDTADTLGWILARNGQAQQSVRLLRTAMTATNATKSPNRGIGYHLAFALRAVGKQEEATQILEQILAGDAAFVERSDAQRLLSDLRAKR